MSVVISRPINGITINGDEYLLESDEDTAMKFKTKEDAVNFLRNHGAKISEIANYTFHELEDDE